VSVTALNAAAEERLIRALRAGEEQAFAELVTSFTPALQRVARLYVRDRAVAEEVVQEAWLGVLRGIERFEGRSSFRTWLFRILTNVAKTRAVREGRTVPFSALAPEDEDEGTPSVPSERFRGPDDRWGSHWATPPEDWDLPETRLLSGETRTRISEAIERLPMNQRTVISLRDVEGWSSEEVCNVLELSETNQRVLLHRARSKVRQELEDYFQET
jgi:RNA polymerase sigma-70 factor (ECF subfamily)